MPGHNVSPCKIPRVTYETLPQTRSRSPSFYAESFSTQILMTTISRGLGFHLRKSWTNLGKGEWKLTRQGRNSGERKRANRVRILSRNLLHFISAQVRLDVRYLIVVLWNAVWQRRLLFAMNSIFYCYLIAKLPVSSLESVKIAKNIRGMALLTP